MDADGRLDTSQAVKWLGRPHILKRLSGRIEACLKLKQEDPLDGEPLRPEYDPILGHYLMDAARLAWRHKVPTVWAAIPSSPYPISDTMDLTALESMAETLRAEGVDVRVFHHPQLLRRLQQPQYFKDCQHLNAEGAARLSRALGRDLARGLGPRQ